MINKNHSITFNLFKGYEVPEGEQRHTSTLSLTSALNGGGWPTLRPGRFTPWKEQDAGWVLGSVWTGAKNLASAGIRSTDFPVRRESYTDWAIPTHECVRN
jgi:hypothetical protein